MMYSKAQIIATIGPASHKAETLKAMIEHQMDVIRFNFSWGDFAERTAQIACIRRLEKECDRRIVLIADLPGPRVQGNEGHSYDHQAISAITDHDKECIKFAVEQDIDYVAVSFVGNEQDIEECKKAIAGFGGKQKVIAKIERKIALESLDAIISAADAVMVARGDLGNEVSLEQIPFIQDRIIKKTKEAGKPVITATQMMLSMVESKAPTRAEVTDVANAIIEGSDAVMLSEETAKGRYPVEAVAMMEKIVIEAEKHMGKTAHFNLL